MGRALGRIAEAVRRSTIGVVAALLPAPESHRVARRFDVDVAFASVVIGVLELPLAVLLYLGGALQFITGQGTLLSMLLLENWFKGLTNVHMQGAGLVGALAWLLHPLSWLLALQAVTGGLRLLGFAFHREPVGEPLVWVVVRLTGLLRRRSDRAIEARRLGPWRRDRLTWDGSELEIVSCRRRPEWEEGGALEVDGRFARLLDASERPDGSHFAWFYHFVELGETETVRGLRAYRPPTLPARQTGAARSRPVYRRVMKARSLALLAVVAVVAGLTILALESHAWLRLVGFLLAAVGGGVPAGVLLRRHTDAVDRRARDA